MQPSTLFLTALASASVAMGLPFNLFRPNFSGGSAPIIHQGLMTTPYSTLAGKREAVKCFTFFVRAGLVSRLAWKGLV
ncbi:uncharacterized protein TRIREDRAFT_111764 [Trichoderma reesei QM6a]|uniref:Predicted protein n=2 Tax=Hypocrea jecorina TaxID=51453 RepID=G0RVD1_HYPJQ|nr:uncharacterized protein TRIREDRAFT_111764 [Trichoderma reesei QM6a]EGR44845.1 predicted protein [Trichoderma reesei QM6a]ETR97729.1 hypothetical protein M419DRAFT_90962 [Trichoderma reesei RUT C-30]